MVHGLSQNVEQSTGLQHKGDIMAGNKRYKNTESKKSFKKRKSLTGAKRRASNKKAAKKAKPKKGKK